MPDLRIRRTTLAATLPFAVWIVLMTLLPATAGAYALRSAVTALALVVAYWGLRPVPAVSARAAGWGILAGLFVAAFWIFPEESAWYRHWILMETGAAPEEPSAYDPAVCGRALMWAKLAGSAFVIAPAEELFFRSFLYRRLQARDWHAVPQERFDPGAFLWTVGLFALEHPPRFLVAALCGAVYGVLYMRKGLAAAIVAHALTNLLLALYVINFQKWSFW